jgi:hypothetical protein
VIKQTEAETDVKTIWAEFWRPGAAVKPPEAAVKPT